MKTPTLIRTIVFAASLLLQLSILSIQLQGAAGDLDLSFDPGSGVNGTVNAVAVQPDGKVIIGGEFTTVRGLLRTNLARLNANGSGDGTFDSAALDYPVHTLALQPDGKVLVGHQNGITRCHSNGSSDTDFQASANTWDDGYFDGNVVAMAVQLDGKIIIGGEFNTVNGMPTNVGIARLNSDGSLDNSFSAPSLTSLGWYTPRIHAVALQPDGKVLVGGNFSDGTNNSIARLNSDGSLDHSFDAGSGANGSVSSIAVQSDGKVFISGSFTTVNGTSRNRIARLHADGSLDGGFDPGTGANGTINSMGVQSDGKVFIGGGFTMVNDSKRSRIARLNANGSLDGSFNPGTGADGTVLSMGVQSDGKLLLGGGFTMVNDMSQNRMARLNADGGLDGSFLHGGGLEYPASSLALQGDGKVLTGPWLTSAFINGVNPYGWDRLNVDGSKDSTFAPSVFSPNYEIAGADYTVAESYAVQPDGKVLIGGWTATTLTIDEFDNHYFLFGWFVNRVNADGSRDTNFSPAVGGTYSTWAVGNIARRDPYCPTVRALAVQQDGKVLVGHSYGIIRRNSNGSPDAGFINPCFTDVNAIMVQPDNKVLIGGAFITVDGTNRNRIARLNADGSLDGSFNPGTGANGSLLAVALQPDGKVIIGGSFTTVNDINRNHIARLNADGSLDGSFNPGTGANQSVLAIRLQPDGKVLIGGEFLTVNGVLRPHVARLYGDTFPPPSFAAWASSFNLSGAAATADADPDFDGLANAAEFILGGNPSQPSPTIPRPTLSLTGDSMLFTFTRLDASETAGVSLSVEASTDLMTWPAVFTIGPTTATSSPGVGIIENGTAPDTITVTIPRNAAARLFARMKVAVAP